MQSFLFFKKKGGRYSRQFNQLIPMGKLTIVFMFVFCLQAMAKTSAQNVTYSENNVKVEKVLQHIQSQTGYNIVADQSLLNSAGRVRVSFKNTPLKDALLRTLNGLSIDFEIEGKTIIIKKSVKREAAAHAPVKEGLTEWAESAPSTIIRGKVISDEGTPLAKVSIFNQTHKKGVYTADDGTFEIEANVGNILTVVYVGYSIQQIKITSTKDLKIELIALSTNLDSIVVTGYQNIRKNKMTGASSSVKAEDLVINGTNTIEQMLQGKLPGVEIVNNSGEIGTSQTVRVRGTSTLYGNQSPVWVVDGIIQEDPLPFSTATLTAFGANPSNSDLLKNYVGNSIAWLNPYDIDEITVLKDAASTAIYGVKAANGVIIITTKRGKIGRAPSINYNSSYSTQQKLTYDKMNLMNSKDRVDVSREVWERGLVSQSTTPIDIGYSALLNQYLNKLISYDEFNAGVKQLETVNTDWFKLLYQNPFNESQNLSIGGGGSFGTYYASFGYNSLTGQAKGNGQTSYKASINATANPVPKLLIKTSLSATSTKTTGFYMVNPYTYASQTSRVIPAFNPDGSLFYYTSANGFKYNVLNELNNSGNQNNITSINGSLDAKYSLPAGFDVESILGVNTSVTHTEAYQTEFTNAISAVRRYEYGAYGPSDLLYQRSQLPRGGMLSFQDYKNTNYTWRNQLSYNKTMNKKHNITAMTGFELRGNTYNGNSSTLYGYLPDVGKSFAFPPITILDANGATIPNSLYNGGLSMANLTQKVSNYVSYYVTSGYTYDQRYTFSVSARGDASNQFGADTRNRFKPIWALGGRWNLAREHFLDNRAKWMNDISLRASYGYQGNVAENYGPDLVLKYMSGTTTPVNQYTGGNVLLLSQLPYGNLRPEKVQTANLGLDFTLFDSRVSGSVDYYTKHSEDLITIKDVPYENGVLSMPVNSGTLSNKGMDIALNFTPVRNKQLTWTIGLVSSRNLSKITSTQASNLTWLAATSGTYYVQGYAPGSFWVFDFAGLDSATGIPRFNIPTAADNPNAKTDATAYMKYAGKKVPDFTGNFNTTIAYKSLTVSTNFYISIGGKKILAPLFTSDIVNNVPSEYNNYSADLVNRWRKPGDEKITNIPSLAQYGVPAITLPTDATAQTAPNPYTMYNFSTARVVNATYMRINNLNVSYALPVSIAKKLLSKKILCTYTVSNPYTWLNKDYKGRDLEVASGSQPLPVSHVFSISATF